MVLLAARDAIAYARLICNLMPIGISFIPFHYVLTPSGRFTAGNPTMKRSDSEVDLWGNLYNKVCT